MRLDGGQPGPAIALGSKPRSLPRRQQLDLLFTVPDRRRQVLRDKIGNPSDERGKGFVLRLPAKWGQVPLVRGADPATVVVADGFSCRTQIEHGTGRRAVHLAQLIEQRLLGPGEAGEEAGITTP